MTSGALSIWDVHPRSKGMRIKKSITTSKWISRLSGDLFGPFVGKPRRRGALEISSLALLYNRLVPRPPTSHWYQWGSDHVEVVSGSPV